MMDRPFYRSRGLKWVEFKTAAQAYDHVTNVQPMSFKLKRSIEAGIKRDTWNPISTVINLM